MEQTDILRHVVDVLERLGVPYFVVGSYASIAYGEARLTQDVDIVAAFDTRHVDALLGEFPSPEYYLSEAALREAIQTSTQFNVIHPASGQKIDFILPRGDRWAAVRMARRRPVRLLPDRDVMTAAPEDVILGKLWYYSLGGGDRHLRDIAGMLRISGKDIDRAEVERWARELGFLDAWQHVLAKVDSLDSPHGPGAP